jgi:hypothetical protein
MGRAFLIGFFTSSERLRIILITSVSKKGWVDFIFIGFVGIKIKITKAVIMDRLMYQHY